MIPVREFGVVCCGATERVAPDSSGVRVVELLAADAAAALDGGTIAGVGAPRRPSPVQSWNGFSGVSSRVTPSSASKSSSKE